MPVVDLPDYDERRFWNAFFTKEQRAMLNAMLDEYDRCVKSNHFGLKQFRVTIFARAGACVLSNATTDD